MISFIGSPNIRRNSQKPLCKDKRKKGIYGFIIVALGWGKPYYPGRVAGCGRELPIHMIYTQYIKHSIWRCTTASSPPFVNLGEGGLRMIRTFGKDQ